MGKDLCENVLKAAQFGDEMKLITLLNDITSKNVHWTKCTNKNSDNILHVGSRNKHLKVISLLFEKYKANSFINVGNKTGKTPLHEATQNCCFDIVNYLLSQEADSNAFTSNGWTPLMLAASKREKEALAIVQILIHYKADPFITNKDGWTAFHVACRNGDTEIVKYFIDNFPSLVQVKTRNGRYPVHTAALYGHFHVVEMLLQANSTIASVPDFCGTTPIHEAARSNNCQIMKLLIKKGASINEVDSMGLNCLHMAAQTGTMSVIMYLISECEVNVNVVNQINSFTPLHYAAQAGQSDAIKHLLKHGAEPEMKDSKGRTALQVSYGKDHETLLQILQEHKNRMNVDI